MNLNSGKSTILRQIIREIGSYLMKRVVIQLAGGLGNQLFQYHAGFLFAKMHGAELFLDISRILNDKTISKRRILGMEQKGILGFFLPEGRIVGNHFFSKITMSNRFIRVLEVAGISKLIDYSPNGEVGESLSQDDFNISLPSRGSIRVRGYFQSLDLVSQSINYGSITKPKLVNESLKLKDSLAIISSGNSLAIHVRLTDYLNDSTSTLVNTDYYVRAFKEIYRESKYSHVFIFSDDIAHCKRILPQFIVSKVTNWISEKELSDVESFFLMTKFSSLIISNSTFSYFAAFYSERTTSVIAPHPWFKSKDYCVSLKYPKGWKTLSV